ncbi:transposase [Streptomyces sp. NBC_00376]|uniref:transposase n=1 Tax=Streptomyces sp. NBC_00376 TaxID=2975730 RepID=UPI003FCC7CF4
MRRHESSDAEWEFVRVLLPVSPRGRRRLDDRRVLNGIVWKFRTGTASGGGPWTARSNGCSGPPGQGPTRSGTSTGSCRSNGCAADVSSLPKGSMADKTNVPAVLIAQLRIGHMSGAPIRPASAASRCPREKTAKKKRGNRSRPSSRPHRPA